MPTLLEHAQALHKAFPNQRIYLSAMAKVFWPDADWLDVKIGHNNGGARKGARLAAGMAGKMARKGYLTLDLDNVAGFSSPTAYRVNKKAIDAAAAALSEEGKKVGG